MKLDKNKMKSSIWLKTRRKLTKQSTVKNGWTATKNQLVDDRARISFFYQSEPNRREIIEYQIYNELIRLCSENEIEGGLNETI